MDHTAERDRADGAQLIPPGADAAARDDAADAIGIRVRFPDERLLGQCDRLRATAPGAARIVNFLGREAPPPVGTIAS